MAGFFNGRQAKYICTIAKLFLILQIKKNIIILILYNPNRVLIIGNVTGY